MKDKSTFRYFHFVATARVDHATSKDKEIAQMFCVSSMHYLLARIRHCTPTAKGTMAGRSRREISSDLDCN